MNQHINALYTLHYQNLRLKTSKFEVSVRKRKGIEVYEPSTNAPYLWAHVAQFVLLLVHTSTSKSGYNMYGGWTKTDYQDKHCITDQTDKGT
jgi:hypothetical protein